MVDVTVVAVVAVVEEVVSTEVWGSNHSTRSRASDVNASHRVINSSSVTTVERQEEEDGTTGV